MHLPIRRWFAEFSENSLLKCEDTHLMDWTKFDTWCAFYSSKILLSFNRQTWLNLLIFKAMLSTLDMSYLAWSGCLHWLDCRPRSWLLMRWEPECGEAAWSAWCHHLPWCVLSGGWMLLLHCRSSYRMITPVTWVCWCHPALKWLSDKPPSFLQRPSWFRVSSVSKTR